MLVNSSLMFSQHLHDLTPRYGTRFCLHRHVNIDRTPHPLHSSLQSTTRHNTRACCKEQRSDACLVFLQLILSCMIVLVTLFSFHTSALLTLSAFAQRHTFRPFIFYLSPFLPFFSSSPSPLRTSSKVRNPSTLLPDASDKETARSTPMQTYPDMSSLHNNGEKVYSCICGYPGNFEDWICCDSPDCPVEWYHYECVHVTEPPAGDWFCPQCTERAKTSTTTSTSTKAKAGSKPKQPATTSTTKGGSKTKQPVKTSTTTKAGSKTKKPVTPTTSAKKTAPANKKAVAGIQKSTPKKGKAKVKESVDDMPSFFHAQEEQEAKEEEEHEDVKGKGTALASLASVPETKTPAFGTNSASTGIAKAGFRVPDTDVKTSSKGFYPRLHRPKKIVMEQKAAQALALLDEGDKHHGGGGYGRGGGGFAAHHQQHHGQQHSPYYGHNNNMNTYNNHDNNNNKNDKNHNNAKTKGVTGPPPPSSSPFLHQHQHQPHHQLLPPAPPPPPQPASTHTHTHSHSRFHHHHTQLLAAQIHQQEHESRLNPLHNDRQQQQQSPTPSPPPPDDDMIPISAIRSTLPRLL